MFKSVGEEEEKEGLNEFHQEILPGVLMLCDFAMWGDYYSNAPAWRISILRIQVH